MTLISSVNINQNICGCDGSFAILASNGSTPYSYSIDNGSTYRNTPLFTNLCPGQYSIIVKDVSGVTSTNSVILNKSNNFTNYVVSLITTSKTLSENNTTLTKKYETNISVFPSLPSGVTINFNLTHTNTSKSSPFSGSSTATSVSNLVKNSSTQSLTYSSTTTGTTYNSTPGCQNQTVFIKSLSEGWNNVSYTISDTITLTTITSVIKNQDIACYLGQSTEIYNVSNISISGCYCCSVSIA